MKARDLLIFVSGMAAGVLGAYLIGKREFEVRVAREVDAAKEYYEKKRFRASEKLSELKEEAVEILNKYNTMKHEEEKEEEVVSTTKAEPYAISPVAYVTEAPDFDKVSLTYFEDDDILYYEEGDEIFDDRERHLGPDGLSHFGELCDSVDEAYIRNEDEEVDYEILRVHGNYSTNIMGEGY